MKRLFPLILIIAVALPLAFAYGWNSDGHKNITALAVEVAGKKLPNFFSVKNCQLLLKYSVDDPDNFKYRDMPITADAEGPEHYIHYDVMCANGLVLPERRYDFIRLCARNGFEPDKVGMLPYAVYEWTEKLACAISEWRRAPKADKEVLSYKCIVYAGLLAHYAQDLCMPLHTTSDYNFKSIPEIADFNIHAWVDSLLEDMVANPADIGFVKTYDREGLFNAIIAELQLSHSRLVELKRLCMPMTEAPKGITSDEVRAFAIERYKAAVRFTASLFQAAEEISASHR